MITVKQKKINIEDVDEKVVYYPDIFSGPIISEIRKNLNEKSILSLSVGLAMITEKIYKPRVKKEQYGSLACICLEKETIVFTKDKKKIEVTAQPGSVLILGADFRQNWEYILPEIAIKMYEENYLPAIYLSIQDRLQYREKVRDSLVHIGNLPMWKQCMQNEMDLQLVGKGSYANVFKSGYLSLNYAVKMSKLKPEAVKHPYDNSFSSWHEVFFLDDIFKPLLEKNICPNLPLLYDTFTCDNCNLVLDDEKITTHCVITIVELASGSFKDYLQEKRKIEELYSALFQIMAALHTIQHYAQIMNFDIKKENILYYDVVEGGYWKYKIKGEDYYVPNFGTLFVLNDFGISRPMSPKYPLYKTENDKTFRLGSRYAVIKDNRFVPFDVEHQKNEDGDIKKPHQVEWENGKVSLGAEFRIDRKNGKVMKLPVKLTEEISSHLQEILTTNSVSYKFFDPEVIPPFEFYNDTQDVIRMFIGGKRTTQKGNHKLYSTIPKKFIKDLEPYLGQGDSAAEKIFSFDPAQVLAGYFIQSFFSEYRKKPKNAKIIATYTISI